MSFNICKYLVFFAISSSLGLSLLLPLMFDFLLLNYQKPIMAMRHGLTCNPSSIIKNSVSLNLKNNYPLK